MTSRHPNYKALSTLHIQIILTFFHLSPASPFTLLPFFCLHNLTFQKLISSGSGLKCNRNLFSSLQWIY